MNILLVEDEPLAARRLTALLREVAPEATVVGQTESVRETVRWLDENRAPDLLLLDIQLADGLSFELFQKTHVGSPVIFTTAYDEYALRAFKVNSVDYLLKPIEKDELGAALEKFRRTRSSAIAPSAAAPGVTEQLGHLLEAYGVKPVPHRSRFLLKQGGRFDVVETADVAYLYAEDKVVFLVTGPTRKYIVDETLDELERQLDPRQFFRLNRKYLARLEAIERIEPHFNGKLRVWLRHRPAEEEIFVSRERAEAFKGWLNQ